MLIIQNLRSSIPWHAGHSRASLAFGLQKQKRPPKAEEPLKFYRNVSAETPCNEGVEHFAGVVTVMNRCISLKREVRLEWNICSKDETDAASVLLGILCLGQDIGSHGTRNQVL